MSNALIDNSTLMDIADAIRAKLETQETMLPSEMAGNIRQISGGGGGTYQQKTVHPSAVSQTVNPDSGYDALSSVTVEGIELQSKSATPSVVAQTIEPDSGKDGLSQVTIAAATLQAKSATAGSTAQTITADAGYYGLSSVEVAASGGGSSTLDLLWTNPSPNVSFSAQTVSIDLTDYSAVVIVCNGNDGQVVPDPYPGSTKPTGNQCFVMKGADGNIPFGSQIAGAATYAWRKITVSDSGVVFGAGYYQQGTATSGSVNNVYATPLKIYGLKLATNS